MYKHLFSLLLFVSLTLSANSNFDLLRYSYIGDTAKVKDTLKLHPDIYTQDDEQMTPFLYAAYKNHLNTVKLLVKNKADINALSHSGRNALVYAFANKNIEMVEYMLQVGVKPVIYNKDKDILYTAIESGESELVKIALPFIANKNSYYELNAEEFKARNRVKTTLLIRAIYIGNLESVKLLLKNGADINKPNGRDETPIMSALRERELKIASFLFKQGAKLDGVDAQGNTVLSYAIALGQTEIALKAIEFADLNRWFTYDTTKNKNGWRDKREWDIKKDKTDKYVYNYLHLAILSNNAQVLKVLLDKGMDLKVVDRIINAKLPPLAWAIKKGNYEVFKLLLDAGANPYERYRGPAQGDSPFMYSAGGGSFYTPLSYALVSENFNKKIIKSLLALPHFENFIQTETHAFYRTLLSYAYTDSPRVTYAKEILNRFKDGGFNLNSEDKAIEKSRQKKLSNAKKEKPKSNYYLIAQALDDGNIETIKKLQKSGVDLQKSYNDAPYMAIVEGHPEMVLELLDLGYDVNMRTSFNNKGLLQGLTFKIDNRKIEKLFFALIKKGADINSVDDNGLTPLFYVINSGDARKTFINKLLKMGASLGDDVRVLDKLFTMRSESKALRFINNPYLQNNLNELYEKANFTQLALKSLKSKKTPLSLTELLFSIAYEKDIQLDYDAVYKYAQKRGLKSMFKIISFYSGDKSKLWRKNIVERYKWRVDKGRVEEALEFYLSNAKILNIVKNLHNWDKSPLYIAIQNHKTSYYKKLIKSGAIIDDKEHLNVDALIEQNDLKSIKLFVKLGMDINHVDNSKNSYFFRTLHHSNKNTSLAKGILKLGYDLHNKNLSRERTKRDINLAYKLALEKNDKELSSIISKLRDKSSLEAYEYEVYTKDGKLSFKGSDVLFSGKVKSNYSLYERVTSYRDGIRHGETVVTKPSHTVFAVAYYIDGHLVSGIVMQDSSTKHITICQFKNSGEIKKCIDKVNGRVTKPLPSDKAMSQQRVAEILREI